MNDFEYKYCNEYYNSSEIGGLLCSGELDWKTEILEIEYTEDGFIVNEKLF